jgi:hypothetical protein
MILVERINPEPAPLQFRVLCKLIARPSSEFVPFYGPSYSSLANTGTEFNDLELAPI